MERGEIWWAELPEPDGASSGPAGRRPVLIVSSNAFNKSRINTVVVAILTGNLSRAAAPGNVLVAASQSGLPRDSVVNVSQLFTVDRATCTEKVANLPARLLHQVDDGLRLALGL